MESIREDLFIDELKTQIDFALFSVDEMKEVLKTLESRAKIDSDRFWYNAQNFVVYSANISKILWGVKDRNYQKNQIRKQERNQLRNKLKIENNSRLKNRNLRNALEHIDEKLEDFTSEPQSIILNRNIGPVKNMISIAGDVYDISKEKNLRHFDPNTNILYFYGEKVNLEENYKEILKLKDNIEDYEK